MHRFRFFSLCLLCLLTLCVSTGAKRCKKGHKPPPLASIHIIDRNGFTETISQKERLGQFQQVDFLSSQPYQKVLRIYGRDAQGNIRAIVTTYHENGNCKQCLDIFNGRAHGNYYEWHENGQQRLAARIIGGMPDVTPLAERSWLFDGVTSAWDEEGRKSAEISYSKGCLEGVSLYFHSNGQTWKRIPYLKNEIHGITEIFRNDGSLLQQIPYTQGQKHGIAMRYWEPSRLASQEEYCRGKLEQGQYFDSEERLVAEIRQGNGIRAIFNKTGIHELQEYVDGAPEGEVKVFDESGRLKRLYHVKQEIKHGEEIEFDERNTPPRPRLSFHWYEGKVQGVMKSWYPSGQLESQREMANNLKHGLLSAWYRDGTLMLLEEYEKGILVRGEYFKKGEKIPVSQVIDGKGTATLFDADGHLQQKVSYLNGKPEA